MVAIENIAVAEIQEFYPVTDSLSQHKIDEVANQVKNLTFLEMFGAEISKKIFDGTIADSASTTFIGFRKFVCLCIAGNFCEETFIHTNAGLKAINQPNWSSPTAMTKNTTLIKINNVIEAQFREAKKILRDSSQEPKNDFAPYSSFQIDKI